MGEVKSVIGTQNKKEQTYTDPWYLLKEAPRTPSFFTGSEVIKEAIRRASCDVMIAYPITPQSEAAALIGELFAEGYVGDYFRGERVCSPRPRGPGRCGPWKTSRCGRALGCRSR
jgi:pyruvate ferredoxin oxidoreductase alpha subunit